MKDSKPLIIVLSRTPSIGLGVVRAFGKAGYTVDLISSVPREGRASVIKESRFIRKHTEIVQRKEKDFKNNELIDAIEVYLNEPYSGPAILFPTDEYTSAFLEANRIDLEANFIIPFSKEGTGGTFADVLTYDFQSELAAKAGFKKLKSWNIDLDDIVIPDDVEYPCVCKPCDYITASAAESMVIRDDTELKIHLNMLRRRNSNRSAVIYILPDTAVTLEINGVSLGEVVVVPAIVKYISYARYNRTVPTNGKLCSVEEFKNACDKSVDMIKGLNYTGLFSLKVHVVGDTVYFDQMQLSAGPSNYVYSKCGINLPAILIDKIINGKEKIVNNVVADKTFVFDNVIYEDYKRDLINKGQHRQLLSGSSIKIIRDSDDPAPGKVLAHMSKNKLGYEDLSFKRRVKNFIKEYVFPVFRPLKQLIRQYPQLDPANDRNPDSERPRVIVSGRNYGSNLCIARAIGKAGYEVEVLRVFHRKPKMRQLLRRLIPDAYSKYIKAFWVCVYGGKSKRVVNKLVSLADPDRKMLIIPADDLVACIIDDYYDELSQYFVLPNVNNKSGEINRLMSKSVQKELAMKAGLPVVKSCIIKTEEGKFEIPDTIDYPCFIKPNISKNGSKTKMRRCDSEGELRSAIEEISETKDVEMLVEDFIEIGREYSTLGISTKNGAIGPGFFGAEEGGQVEHRGVAVTGKVLPCNITPQWEKLISDTVKFVGSLNFDGLYDVDYVETVDGKLYFIEVNMRFGGSGYAITESGLNLPGMFADYMLLDKPIDMDCKLEETGKRFVSEKVLIEEYVKNRITMSRLNRIMDDVDIHFIKDEQDPKAFKHFKKFYKIAALYRLVYKIKDTSDSEFGK